MKTSVSVPLRCDPARRNKNLPLLLQVFERWDLQGVLGVWNSPHPAGRCCSAGQPPCNLPGPGHLLGQEDVSEGEGPGALVILMRSQPLLPNKHLSGLCDVKGGWAGKRRDSGELHLARLPPPEMRLSLTNTRHDPMSWHCCLVPSSELALNGQDLKTRQSYREQLNQWDWSPGVSVRWELGICWAPVRPTARPASAVLCGIPWEAVLFYSLWSPTTNQLLQLRLILRRSGIISRSTVSALFASIGLGSVSR